MRSAQSDRAGHSLIQVVGALVTAGILLAIVSPAVGHAVRVRLAEGVMRSDLQNAVNLYEQAYLGESRYPGVHVLDDQLSPGIAVDSAAVNGDRVFLRLQHVATGQRCSVDYSRSSPVARNRPDCYGGGLPRDTALTLTPGLPDAPGTDTFRIPPPALPDSGDDNELGLRNPAVSNPGDQSGAPGAVMSQSFLVTNRSPVARTYRFETGSSNPEVAGTPEAPPAVTIAPGAPAEVRVTYTANPGALADGVAVIPLRAVDVAGDRWSATGSFSFTTELALSAPAVELDGPTDRVATAGGAFEVTWRVTNRSNAPRVLALALTADPRHLRVTSLAPNARVTFGPGETRTVTGRVQIVATSDGGTRSNLLLRAEDAQSPVHGSSAAVAIETETVLAAPAVAVPAAAPADPGRPFTLSWRVRNRSNAARDLQVDASVLDPAHLEIVSAEGTGTRRVGREEEVVVAVTYRVRDGSVAGRTSDARLDARDRAAPEHAGWGTLPVRTSLVLAAPAITSPAPQSAKPGEEVTVTWSVQNRSNDRRRLAIEAAAGGELTLVGASGADETSFAAFEVRAVTARYRVRDGSLAGAAAQPTLGVTDTQAAGLSASATFRFTTAADVRAPTLSAPPDRRMDAGDTGAGVFRLVNRSNVGRTFSLTARSSDPSVAGAQAALASVDVDAFGAVDVHVHTAVPAGALGNSTASVELAAADGPEHGAAAAFGVAVNAVYLPPVLQWGGRRVLRPGVEASDTAVVINRSNVPVSMCFRLQVISGSADAGQVARPAERSPACRALGPVGTASAASAVPVRYAAAPEAHAGWTNGLVLTAYHESVPSRASTGESVVEADLVLGSPQWVRIPASPQFWNVGEERALGYTFRNTSNGERSFCVVITSADPDRLAPAEPERVCGIRVPAYDTARVVHTLRALGPGTSLSVEAVSFDEEESGLRAAGRFYNVIRETRPSAVWDAPRPVYVRRWASFDASRSWSPVGASITRYIWTWGLFMQQWDPAQGRFIYTGRWENATDEVSSAVIDRAYDVTGTFVVCLTVVDAAGRRSEPNCQTVSVIRSTIARLAWRYRGWWTNQDFCLDVWWDNQCDPEHGNSRWEVDLRASEGDVPIQSAYAVVRVKLHNTDDPDRPETVTYASNVGTTPEWGSYSFGSDFPAAVGKASAGLWRVLSTEGTAARGWPSTPRLTDHPLVLNVNLAKATGAFDTGPHWVPDEAWITLHVQDADGRWTSASGYRDHDKGQWRAAYDTIVTAEAPPVASVSVTSRGDGTFTAIGAGSSPEGRIVDAWWEVSSEDAVAGAGGTWTSRQATVELRPGPCERVTATYVVRDDQGKEARASASVSGGGGRFCVPGALRGGE